jgi:SAM-dependent methyltransferase
LFVVADVARLPFKDQAFDGEVSLHTIHHLPEAEHARAYGELYRTLAPGGSAVVVNGWDNPPLMALLSAPLRWRKSVATMARRMLGKPVRHQASKAAHNGREAGEPKGTYVSKNSAARLKRTVGAAMPLEIWVWRSVSVRFLRGVIHPRLGGRWLLRLLFWLEERFPHFFGENGQYPLIVVKKSEPQ